MYCQLVESEEVLLSLASDITSYVESNPSAVHLSQVSVGSFLLGQFAYDDLWYRGRVLSVKSETVTLQFVDYGNEEELPPSRLLAIPPSLCSWPCQAVECMLEGLDSLKQAPKADEVLGELVLNAECSLVCVLVEADKLHVVNLSIKGKNVIDLALESTALEKVCTSSPAAAKSKPDAALPVKLSYSVDSLVPDSTVQAYIAHVDSPFKYVCQLTGCEPILEELMVSMQEQYCGPRPQTMASPMPGEVVVALFEDGWYRAEVISVDELEKTAKVCYLDYGNSETVSLADVRPLLGKLREVPVQGIPCKVVSVVPIENQQALSTILQEFTDVVQDNRLTLHVSDVSEHLVTIARVFNEDGRDVYEDLVQKGCAQWKDSQATPTASQTQLVNCEPSPITSSSAAASLTPTTPQKYTSLSIAANDTLAVYVSHIESETEFWVHPVVESLELSQLSEQMKQTYENEAAGQAVTSPACGMPVCAQFSEDLQWYRALVMTVDSDGGLEVLFVDFGNSETVLPPTKVYHLKEEFLCTPALAICCRSAPGSTVTLDGCEAISLFFVSQDERNGTWEVKPESEAVEQPSPFPRPSTPPPVASIPKLGLSPGQQYPVYLPVTESPTEFWCQLSSELEKLDELMARIADYYTDNRPQPILESGTFCVAQFVENKSLYRARIVKVNSEQEATVLFVDYGNQEVVNVTEVLRLEPQFATFPCQAFCCTLFSSDQVDFSGDRLEVFFSLPLDEEEFTVVLDHLLPSGKWLVQLIDQRGHCINNMLATPAHSPSNSSLPLSQFSEVYSVAKYPVGSEVDVYVTCIASPSSFYCQPLELAGELEDLMNRIGAYVMSSNKSQPNVESTWLPGQSCLGCYSIDGDWYRGFIEEFDNVADKYLVRYVDYGNSEFLTADQLLPLPAEYQSVPIQALLCSVAKDEWLGYEEHFEWPESSVEKFKTIVQEDEQVMLKIVSFSQILQKYTVDVVIGGRTLDFSYLQVEHHQYSTASTSGIHDLDDMELGNQFIGLPPGEGVNQSVLSADITELSTVALKGSKTPTTDMEESEGESAATGEPLIHAPFNLSLAHGEVVDVSVVHIKDPSLIYVQRVDCASALDALAQEIDQYCQDFADKLVQFSYQPGDFVLAQCSLDKCWYRARVLTTADSQFEVQFIDYGNTEMISPDRMIMCSANFLELPVQAIPCSLSQVPSRENWPEEYNSLLNNLVGDKMVSVTVVVAGSHGMPPTVVMIDKETGVQVSHKVLERLQEECDAGAAIAGGNLLADAYAIVELPEEEEEEKKSSSSKGSEDNREEKPAFLSVVDNVESGEEHSPPADSPLANDLLSPGPIEGRKSTALIKNITSNSDRSVEEDPNKICKFSELPLDELKLGTRYKVFVVDIVSPSDFSCQLACRSDTIEAMNSVMAQIYDHDENVYCLPCTPAVGDLVAARYEKDDNLYRSVVRGYHEHEQLFEVYFIDFGNSMTVPVDKLRRLDTRLASSAPLVLKCSLSGVPEMYHDPNRSSGGLVDKMLDLIGEEPMHMEIQSYDQEEGSYEVVLVNKVGVRVNDEVIRMIRAIEIEYQEERDRREEVLSVSDEVEEGIVESDQPVSTEEPKWSDETCTQNVPDLHKDDLSMSLLTSDSVEEFDQIMGGVDLTLPGVAPSSISMLGSVAVMESPKTCSETEPTNESDTERIKTSTLSPTPDSETITLVSKTIGPASSLISIGEGEEDLSPPSDSCVSHSVPYPSLTPGQRFEVCILRLTSVDDFTCQMVEGEESIAAAIAEAERSEVHPSLNIEALSPGAPVLACSPAFKGWFRAAVTNVDTASGSVSVLFVDQGSNQVLTIDQLKPMDQAMVHLSPPRVFDCQVSPLCETDLNPSCNFPGEEWELEWPTCSTQYLNEFMWDLGTVSVEILSVPEGNASKYTVSLYSGPTKSIASSSHGSSLDLRAAIVSRLREPMPLNPDDSLAESCSRDEDSESVEEDLLEEESEEAREEDEEAGTDPDTKLTGMAASDTENNKLALELAPSPPVTTDPEVAASDGGEVASKASSVFDGPTPKSDQTPGEQPTEEEQSPQRSDTPVKDSTASFALGEFAGAVEPYQTLHFAVKHHDMPCSGIFLQDTNVFDFCE